MSAFSDSLQKAQESGELIFQSGFAIIPHIALLPLVQYVSVNYFGTDFFGKGTNFFRMPRETYIFKVR